MAILSNLASLRLVEHKGTPACRALAAEVANEYTQFCVDMLGAATGVFTPPPQLMTLLTKRRSLFDFREPS